MASSSVAGKRHVVLRIHFTTEDLARTRIAAEPWPFLELDIAARRLQESCHRARFLPWQQNTIRQLSPRARALLALVPPSGSAPAFLFPARRGDVPSLLTEIRATSPRVLEREMHALAGLQPLPRWASRLREPARALPHLLAGLENLYTAALAPVWPDVQTLFEQDRSLRLRHFLEEGVDGLLRKLHPTTIRWTSPMLEISLASGRQIDTHLDGRGVMLVPSVFGSNVPYVDMDAEPQPLITFPARHDRHAPLMGEPAGARHPAPLARLLGATRAALLQAVAERPGRTTSELARALSISVASASEHATVLRHAGLVRAQRHQNSVLHTLTERGRSVLEAPVTPAL